MYFIVYNAPTTKMTSLLLPGGARAIFVECCGGVAPDRGGGVSRLVRRRGAPACRNQPLRGGEPARCPSGSGSAVRIGPRGTSRLQPGGLERSGATDHRGVRGRCLLL